MTEELLSAIEARTTPERNSRSGVVSDLLQVLLLSPAGKVLQERADSNRRTLAQELEALLAQELEAYLTIPESQLEMEELNRLAESTNRTSAAMLAYLAKVGMRTYKRRIEEGNELD